MLQGACQNLQCVPKKIARKRKAPKYGALVFLAIHFLLMIWSFQGVELCPMPVHGALKRCTV